jgi:PTH1 family peptidyl-tRNA hydrolase
LKVVVGLGNPGKKYSGTRHNIGFDVLELLSKRHASDRWRGRFEAETTEILVGSERVLLAAPQTYMNLSGRSVRSVISFFRIPLSSLLVICDDMNLPCGRLRLRRSGTAGGQKGLKNVIDQLGTTEFPRLRIGVGRPAAGEDIVNYVLQPFSKSERAAVDEAIQRAADGVECWLSDGIDAAMTRFNRGDEGESVA